MKKPSRIMPVAGIIVGLAFVVEGAAAMTPALPISVFFFGFLQLVIGILIGSRAMTALKGAKPRA